MTGTVQIIVPGPPVAKARPRVTRRGTYTPAKTRAYEEHVQLVARQAMAGRKPLTGPLRAHVVAVFPVPRSWPKWKRGAALAGARGPVPS